MFFDDQIRAASQRRQELLQRSDRLRQSLGADAQVLRRPLAVADQVQAGWRWLLRHPEVVGGAVLVLTLLRPRRMWRLGTRLVPRLWAGWQLWQRLQRGRALLRDRIDGLGPAARRRPAR